MVYGWGLGRCSTILFSLSLKNELILATRDLNLIFPNVTQNMFGYLRNNAMRSPWLLLSSDDDSKNRLSVEMKAPTLVPLRFLLLLLLSPER